MTEQNKRFVDRHCTPAPTYSSGQKVWLSIRDIKIKGTPKKLSPRYIGSFPLTKSSTLLPSDSSCPLTWKYTPHSMFHKCKTQSVFESPLCPPTNLPLLAWVVDNHPDFNDHCILDVCCQSRGFQDLGDWEGYVPEESSWMPQSLILDPSLISSFCRAYPENSWDCWEAFLDRGYCGDSGIFPVISPSSWVAEWSPFTSAISC